MNVVTHSRHLAGFTTLDALRVWSPSVRAELVDQLMNAPPSEAAWGAFLELLFHWPAEESIEPIVKRAAASLRGWDWRIRQLEHIDPVLSRDGGIAMTLVGQLAMRDVEDLHGLKILALCAHPGIDGLQGLRLHKIETFPEHVGAITRCDALSGLVSLELSKVHLSGGIDTVFGASQLTRLTTLRLSSADLVRADLEALVRAPASSVVEQLNLSGNLFNADDLGILLAADTYPRLKVLDVSDTWLDSDDFEVIVARRRLPALKKIILHGTTAAERFGNEMLL
ncbi:hypothetical protein [Chitinimonas naiadis]